MPDYKILWVDDEIEHLRPHIVFLEGRGYEVAQASNGDDAIEMVKDSVFDAVLLDEMMPGKDGLTTLVELKEIQPGLPVIMITKNEEESLMEEAIGSQIDDYLTKPVNPSQIIMALKKILETARLSKERLSRDYVREFNEIKQAIMVDIALSLYDPNAPTYLSTDALGVGIWAILSKRRGAGRPSWPAPATE